MGVEGGGDEKSDSSEGELLRLDGDGGATASVSASRPYRLDPDALFMVPIGLGAVATLVERRLDGGLEGSGAMFRARMGSMDGITAAARQYYRAFGSSIKQAVVFRNEERRMPRSRSWWRLIKCKSPAPNLDKGWAYRGNRALAATTPELAELESFWSPGALKGSCCVGLQTCTWGQKTMKVECKGSCSEKV